MKLLGILISAGLALATLAPAAHAEEEAAAPAGPMTPEGSLRRTPLENFTLISEFEISKEDLLDVRRHLTNVRREVGRDFVFFPKEKFDVFLTRDTTFREYTNMPGHVKGFFDGSIHLPLPSEAGETPVKAILWHEYTHAVIYSLSGNACPGWLHEGFARYQEAKIKRPDLDLLKRVLVKKQALPLPLEDLDAALAKLAKDPETASVVYSQAYGFADYIYSRFSKQNVRDFVIALRQGGTVEQAVAKVFHLSRKELDKRWFDHLKKLSGA